jgi:hypothetical protein
MAVAASVKQLVTNLRGGLPLRQTDHTRITAVLNHPLKFMRCFMQCGSAADLDFNPECLLQIQGRRWRANLP